MPQPWENDKIVQQAGGPVTVGQVDPSFQYQGATAGATLRGKGLSNTGAAIDNTVAAATAQPKINKAGAEASIEGKKDTTNAGVIGAAERTKALAQYSAAHQLDATIGELRTKFNSGPGSTHGLYGIQDYFSTPENQRFDTAANGARGIVRNALGLTGGENNTMAEANMNLGAYIPQASQYDGTIEDTIGRLERLRDNARSTAIKTLGGVPDQNGNIVPLPADHPLMTGATASAPANDRRDGLAAMGVAGGVGGGPGNPGAGTPPPTPFQNNPGDPGMQQVVAQGSLNPFAAVPTRKVSNPQLASQIDAMMNGGASIEQINGVTTKAGFPPLQASQYEAARQWMDRNPGHKYFGAEATRDEPMTALQRASGSPLGAFGAQYANAATAGSVGALAGEKGRGALDAMAATHPNSSFAGEMIGGVTGAAAGELTAARLLGAKLARYAPMLADTSYGALQGANSAPEGSGIGGAAIGALAGFGGGVAGRSLTRGLGNALTGVRNPEVQALRQANVPLTVGQSVGQSAGWMGAGVKGAEDAMTSLPGVGNIIDARRMEGIEGFNHAAFASAGQPIGFQPSGIGSQGIRELNGAKSAAYDNALGGTQIDPTMGNFPADAATARASAGAFPDSAPTFPSTYATQALDNRLPTAPISGRDFQESYRGLGRDARNRATGDYGHEVGTALRQGQDALGTALHDQNPGAFSKFKDANAANRNLMVLAKAVGESARNKGEMFTPAQLNAADSISTKALSGPLANASGNRPFYDLAMAGQKVLPSTLPESGTFKRSLVGAAATGLLGVGGAAAGSRNDSVGASEGGVMGGAGGLGILGLLAAGGSKTVQRGAVKLLLDRPDLFIRAGNGVKRKAIVQGGGILGAGGLAGLLAASGQ